MNFQNRLTEHGLNIDQFSAIEEAEATMTKAIWDTIKAGEVEILAEEDGQFVFALSNRK